MAENNDWYEGLSDEFKAAVDKAASVAGRYSIEELNSSEAGVLEQLKEKMTGRWSPDRARPGAGRRW